MKVSSTSPTVTDKWPIEVPTHKYYAYSLRLNGSKYYYIGVTSNPIRRKDQHMKSITNLFNHKLFNHKTKQSNCYLVHTHILNEIRVRMKKLKLTSLYHFLKNVSLDVIGESESLIDIKRIESELITKSGKYSLNTQKVSHYKPRIIC